MKNVFVGLMWLIFCSLPICSLIVKDHQIYSGLVAIAIVLTLPVLIVVYHFLDDLKNRGSRVDRIIRITLGIYAVLIIISGTFLVCKGIYLWFKSAGIREITLHFMSIFAVLIGLIMLQMARLGYEKETLSNKVRIVPKINFILGTLIFIAAAVFFIEQFKNNIIPNFTICLITYVSCIIGTIFIIRGGIAISFGGKAHTFWPSIALYSGIALPILFGFTLTTVFLKSNLSEKEFKIIILCTGFVGIGISARAKVLAVALFRGAYLEYFATESWKKLAGVDISNNSNKISLHHDSIMMLKGILLAIILTTCSYYTTKHTLYKKHYQTQNAHTLKRKQYLDFTQKLSQQTGDSFQQTFNNIKNFPEIKQFAEIYKMYRYDGAALAYFYWLKEKKKPNNKKTGFLMGDKVSMLRQVNTQTASKDDVKRLVTYQILRHFLGYDLVYRTFLSNSKDPNPKIAKFIEESVQKHEENLSIFQQHIRDNFKMRKKK